MKCFFRAQTKEHSSWKCLGQYPPNRILYSGRGGQWIKVQLIREYVFSELQKLINRKEEQLPSTGKSLPGIAICGHEKKRRNFVVSMVALIKMSFT